MRPWEYWQVNAREMHMVATLLAAWREGYGDAKEAADKADAMKREREAARPQPRQQRRR